MEGRELAYYEMVDLEQADQSIKACLADAARNVIAVGYYLKAIRDRGLFRDAGYETIWDYARETYGFSKSTASRYMARNDRFSVGGNSPVMAAEYREYSRAQLQEMLSLGCRADGAGDAGDDGAGDPGVKTAKGDPVL